MIVELGGAGLAEKALVAEKILEFVIEALGILAFVTTPLVMIWGWIRWARREKRWAILPNISLIGFALATASAALAIALAIYGHAIGGFEFYDPRLMRIYAWGLLISASALILSITGVWRFSSIRWYALVCSVGMLAYWFALAESE